MSSVDYTPPPPLPPKSGMATSFPTARTIAALILREMTTRYGASPGGYFWALLEPLAAITILGFGFALVLKSPSLGNSFLLFYATGYLPYNLYQATSGTIGKALKFSKSLLQYPRVTWLDAILARLILNSLTALLMAYLLLSGILFVVDTRTMISLPPILGAMGLAALVGLATGAMNCLVGGLYPMWTTVWTIITRPLFLASGVIYIYEDLPTAAQKVIWYNPLIHLTGMMRTGFYPTYKPTYISATYVTLTSLVVIVLFFILLQRYHKDVTNAA